MRAGFHNHPRMPIPAAELYQVAQPVTDLITTDDLTSGVQGAGPMVTIAQLDYNPERFSSFFDLHAVSLGLRNASAILTRYAFSFLIVRLSATSKSQTTIIIYKKANSTPPYSIPSEHCSSNLSAILGE